MYAHIPIQGWDLVSHTRFSVDLSLYAHIYTYTERAHVISHRDIHYPLLNIQNCIYLSVLSCSHTNTNTVFSHYIPVGRWPCPWQGGGTRRSLRSLPTQTILWFYDIYIYTYIYIHTCIYRELFSRSHTHICPSLPTCTAYIHTQKRAYVLYIHTHSKLVSNIHNVLTKYLYIYV